MPSRPGNDTQSPPHAPHRGCSSGSAKSIHSLAPRFLCPRARSYRLAAPLEASENRRSRRRYSFGGSCGHREASSPHLSSEAGASAARQALVDLIEDMLENPAVPSKAWNLNSLTRSTGRSPLANVRLFSKNDARAARCSRASRSCSSSPPARQANRVNAACYFRAFALAINRQSTNRPPTNIAFAERFGAA